MKFVAISDTHNKHNKVELPPGDVLLHAGDFTALGRSGELKNFAKWLAKQPFEYKVLTPGNHDIMFEQDWERACSFFDDQPNVHILNQSSFEIDGIKIWGEPRTPAFSHGWVYNVERCDMWEECWSKVSDDVDILLTHGPPNGCGDLVPQGVGGPGAYLEHVGCTKQRKFLSGNDSVKIVVCGHVHEGYGHYRYGGKDIYNVSICNHRYQPLNKPVEFEL